MKEFVELDLHMIAIGNQLWIQIVVVTTQLLGSDREVRAQEDLVDSASVHVMAANELLSLLNKLLLFQGSF